MHIRFEFKLNVLNGIYENLCLLRIPSLPSVQVPVIAMCNDRQHQKIRSLANHCFDLRFARPRVEQIKAAMMSVCFKEKIPIKPDALSELITGCGQDVRQVRGENLTRLFIFSFS